MYLHISHTTPFGTSHLQPDEIGVAAEHLADVIEVQGTDAEFFNPRLRVRKRLRLGGCSDASDWPSAYESNDERRVAFNGS